MIEKCLRVLWLFFCRNLCNVDAPPSKHSQPAPVYIYISVYGSACVSVSFLIPVHRIFSLFVDHLPSPSTPILKSMLSEPPKLKFIHTLTANFLIGKCVARFFAFSLTIFDSCLLKRLRIARVFFGRRSSGRYFLCLYRMRSWERWLALMTVRTRATDLRRSWL